VSEEFGTATILPATAIKALDRHSDGRSSRDGGQSHPKPFQHFQDEPSVLGQDPGQVPVSVQEGIARLVTEIDQLHEKLDRAHRQEDFLKAQLDHHPFLPCLNRRAFLSGVTRLIEAAKRSALPAALVYLQMSGIDRLRVLYGLQASDAALRHVLAAITPNLRQTDLLGHMDGGDFALAMIVSADDLAADKARHLAESVARSSFAWEGLTFQFHVKIGLAPIGPDSGAQQLLEDANAAMIGKIKQ